MDLGRNSPVAVSVSTAAQPLPLATFIQGCLNVTSPRWEWAPLASNSSSSATARSYIICLSYIAAVVMPDGKALSPSERKYPLGLSDRQRPVYLRGSTGPTVPIHGRWSYLYQPATVTILSDRLSRDKKLLTFFDAADHAEANSVENCIITYFCTYFEKT